MAQFPVSIDLSALDGTDGFRLDGIDKNDYSGASLSNAGDINGDGFDDLIIGSGYAGPLTPGPYGYDVNDGRGESYIVFGKAGGFGASIDLSTLDGTNGFRVDGLDVFDSAGDGVAGVGDVNGDGIDDFIIAAPGAGTDPEPEGAAYVVFGSTAGFGATFDLASLDGANGFKIEGVNGAETVREIVGAAGDINGDGIGDIFLGDGGGNPNGNNSAGETNVIFGKDTGFAATVSLGALDGINGFTLEGESSFDFSGNAASAAGDVNGDGFDDIITGAASASEGLLDNGAAYVFFGKAGGFSATTELANLDGVDGFQIVGANARDRIGESVSNAGDINGDGIDDFLIGSVRADPGGNTSAGESYVVFGTNAPFAASFSVADLNGDNGFVVTGIDADDEAGKSVSAAGDVNGDGFDDIIIGAGYANGYTGESYVLFGKAGGFAASIDLASLDGTNGFRIDGVDADDEAGIPVSAAGDINGDGFADLLIGARYADPGGNDSAGESYVIFGVKEAAVALNLVGAGGGQTMLGGKLGDTISGEGGNDLLKGHAGADTLNGGDGDDDLVGGRGFDVLNGDAGDDGLYGSTGNDTLNGGDGNDLLKGNEHDDELNGDAGDDILFGGSGADVLTGGSGADQLFGQGGFDSLFGGDGDDIAVGGRGDDIISGDAGADSLYGSTGNDILFGGAGNDLLKGNQGIDGLLGGDGNDFMFGGDGDDFVQGGIGDDKAFGGSGSDTFFFEIGDEILRIRDWDINGDQDTLGLAGFGFADAAEALATATQAGANVKFALGGGDFVFVENTLLADITAVDIDVNIGVI